MQLKEDNFLLANLKFVPQVSLLDIPKNFFKVAIDEFLKRIVCLKQFCSADDLCHNCQKLKEDCYFDLSWYKFNKSNLMKKQDVSNIINTLSYQSLENNNPKICVIEEIEHSSLEAANVFLKFLENLPENTFLIFVSTNIEKVLPTIKSRTQIFNWSNDTIETFETANFVEADFLLVQDLISRFINHDNNKEFSKNFFLIKEIVELKEKVDLFFQFLLLLAEHKLIRDSNFTANSELKNLLQNWKNNNQIFLINLIESITKLINKFSNTKNLNLNLLLNYFFITIYQGQENGW
ncbi:hypothetical protein [Spiroplasma platyhelix]|uniref:DNA polymerase III subunit delta n=1 Tax=Spiroplasma platyhelix PALS-1 TaxID=1276218 RepID=A0A846TWL1_9MOLU|nr:hypothetical protein [Spiroplasma platyhelix]MBE4704199.1 hypothetical protein [Spiroplasma platyhelix PALS-1]NKE38572.1 hypothetical protein [Spiroplasma platyhelix PALS-1]UJB28783.1 DNA polymerase III subunit delta' [Spiroplasma platyhelix PALS-1]